MLLLLPLMAGQRKNVVFSQMTTRHRLGVSTSHIKVNLYLYF